MANLYEMNFYAFRKNSEENMIVDKRSGAQSHNNDQTEGMETIDEHGKWSRFFTPMDTVYELFGYFRLYYIDQQSYFLGIVYLLKKMIKR